MACSGICRNERRRCWAYNANPGLFTYGYMPYVICLFSFGRGRAFEGEPLGQVWANTDSHITQSAVAPISV